MHLRWELLDRRVKRQRIETRTLDIWYRRGRTRLHFENVHAVRTALRAFLEATHLLARGRANSLAVRIAHLPLRFPNLPAAFDGWRILHLSDLHLDGVPGLTDRLLEILPSLKVDLCLMTGDYRFEVFGSCDALYQELERLLPSIQSRLGVFGVLGNHDFLEEADAMRAMGVKMLVNEAAQVSAGGQSLYLVGLDDPHYYGCDDLTAATRDIPAGPFKIMLVHSPEMIPEADRAGMSLYLCGHTHAGQIRLPGIGPIITHANCRRRFTAGLWRHGSVTGYTSPGAGSSLLPVRYMCPPEVTVFTLNRG